MAVHCVFFSVYFSWKQLKGFCESSYFEYIQNPVRDDKFCFVQMQIALKCRLRDPDVKLGMGKQKCTENFG